MKNIKFLKNYFKTILRKPTILRNIIFFNYYFNEEFVDLCKIISSYIYYYGCLLYYFFSFYCSIKKSSIYIYRYIYKL